MSQKPETIERRTGLTAVLVIHLYIQLTRRHFARHLGVQMFSAVERGFGAVFGVEERLNECDFGSVVAWCAFQGHSAAHPSFLDPFRLVRYEQSLCGSSVRARVRLSRCASNLRRFDF